MSSRTDLYDDVVDATSFLALDVVEMKRKKDVLVVVVGARHSCNKWMILKTLVHLTLH